MNISSAHTPVSHPSPMRHADTPQALPPRDEMPHRFAETDHAFENELDALRERTPNDATRRVAGERVFGIRQSAQEFELDRSAMLSAFRERRALLPGSFRPRRELQVDELFTPTAIHGTTTQLGAVSIASHDVAELRSLVAAWAKLDDRGARLSMQAMREDRQPTHVVFSSGLDGKNLNSVQPPLALAGRKRTLHLSRTHGACEPASGAIGSRAIVFAHEMQHLHTNPYISVLSDARKAVFGVYDNANEYFAMRYESALATRNGILARGSHHGMLIPARDPSLPAVQLPYIENGIHGSLHPGERREGRIRNVDAQRIMLETDDGKLVTFSVRELAALVQPQDEVAGPMLLLHHRYLASKEQAARHIAEWRVGSFFGDRLEVHVMPDRGARLDIVTHEANEAKPISARITPLPDGGVFIRRTQYTRELPA